MSTLQFDYARETFTFNWNIKNFLTLLDNKNIKEYRTKKSQEDSRPQLGLKLSGQNNDLIEFYFLCPVTVFMTYTFNFGMHGSRKQGKCDGKMIEANKWQYLDCILKKDIDTENNRSYFVSLEIYIVFRFFNHSYPQYTSELSSVIDKSLFADVVIQSNDGKEYKTHKFILARNSAVLKAHFEHDTTESHTNIVEAPFESDVVEEIISHMYSDKILRMNKMPDKILAAADFYQLDELKKLCAEELSKQLTIENASKTLDLANLYHEDTLKPLVLEFMKEGIKELINSTESWETVMSVDVMKSIYKYVQLKEIEVQYCEENSE